MNAHGPNMKTEKSGFPNSDSRFGRADYNLAAGKPSSKSEPQPDLRKVLSALLNEREAELKQATDLLEVKHAELISLEADIADLIADQQEASILELSRWRRP